MSLTDHDAIARRRGGERRGGRGGDRDACPAVEMSCVHRYSDDLHVLGYWVDLDAIAPACERAQQERVNRAKEIIERLNAHGVEVSFEDAVAEAGAARLDRPPAHRPRRGRRPRPRPLLRGVPGPGRQGLRRPALADAPRRPSS